MPPRDVVRWSKVGLRWSSLSRQNIGLILLGIDETANIKGSGKFPKPFINHDAGVSFDDLRTLMDHKDRKMTDHYVIEDRQAVGLQLNKIPRLIRNKIALSVHSGQGIKKDLA